MSGAGFRGAWCQKNGDRGDETFGPPSTLLGRHPVQGGNNNSTGTLDVRDSGEFGDGADPWTSDLLAWHTSQGDISGYGIGCCDKFLVAAWGPDALGGIVFYAVQPGKLIGTWAVPGSPETGTEILDRVSGKGRSTP